MRRTIGPGQALLAAACLVGKAPPVDAASGAWTSAEAAIARDSAASRRLPFTPSHGAGQPFAASELTRRYGKDVTQFLRSEPVSLTDLAQLDRMAEATTPGTAGVDSSDLRLVEEQRRRATQLTPQEKEKLVPPQPGAHVGVPSAVAATGALLGGLGLLIKLIVELAR